MVWVAVISGCLGAVVLWELAVIVGLRLFDIKLPLSIAIHIYPRRQREMFAGLKEKGEDTFVFISGVLLWACPLFIGVTAYDLIFSIFDPSGSHPAHALDRIVGSIVVFMFMIACGIWTASREWNKYFHDSSPRS